MNERDIRINFTDDLSSPEPSGDSGDGMRALYSGDISSTILQKFASWYAVHRGSDLRNVDDDYFIIRSGQYDYYAYFGDIDYAGYGKGSIDIIHYQAANNFNNNNAAFDYHTDNNVHIDINGSHAYIYSSHDEYVPNPYMVDYKQGNIASIGLIALLGLCCIISVGILMWRWIRGAKRR